MSGDAPSVRSTGSRRETIALLGPRCSGKTTVGRALAGLLARPFVDLDEELVRFACFSGHRAASAGELLARAGQAVFRDLEAAVAKRVLEPSPRCVVATGGGIVEREDNRAWLARTARCVYLAVPLPVLEARLAADPAARPALAGGDPVAELGALVARRDPLYRGLAEVVVDGGDGPPAAVAQRIRDALARSSAGASR